MEFNISPHFFTQIDCLYVMFKVDSYFCQAKSLRYQFEKIKIAI